MVTNHLVLSFGLPSQNEIIKAAKIPTKQRGGKRPIPGMVYASMKKKNTKLIEAELVAQGCIPYKPYSRIDIECVWIETGKSRDPDNVLCGGLKSILDAMVNQGIIEDDSIKQVNRIIATFERGKERAVIVRWQEVEGR